MGLPAGTKLGPYEIVSPLGTGGMGEVYRAQDKRLDRTVAIKVLNSALTATPDLKARFEREAKAISQLNHPNICTLHDVGHEGDVDFLVMEFLDGESLADRIQAKGALPLTELTRIGSEIAEALDKAHRAGIVHRDLKPGNVMLTKTAAKLLDFGLAKPAAMAAAGGSGSAPLLSAAMTITSPSPQHSPLTQQGSLVGTVQYMSPEQIQGMEADARSDIFAFGAVLYEMATGKRAFEGKSQIKVASAILEDEPAPVSAVHKAAPAVLDRLIRACLAKNPDERFQCAGDLKVQLKWVRDAQEPADKQRMEASRRRARQSRWVMALMTAAALLAGAAVAGLLYRKPPVLPLEAYILSPEKVSFTLVQDDAAGPVVLSPDGKKLAFVAQDEHAVTHLYVRTMDNKDAQLLAGTDDAIYPFWSPDSNSLGFASAGKLRRVAISGGPILEICDVQRFRGGSWGPAGIVFAPDAQSGIFRVEPNAGSKPVQIVPLDTSKSTNRWPLMLPDGKHLLYLAANHSDPVGSASIYFASLDGKENQFLVPTGSNAIYASGYLIWQQRGSLLAQPFEPNTGKMSGSTLALAAGAGVNPSTWRGAFDANDELLIYQLGMGSFSGQLRVVGRDGKSSDIPDSSSYLDVRISPDGRKAAAVSAAAGHDLWLLNLEEGTRSRFTFSVTTDGVAWSADSKYLYYALMGKTNRIVRKAVDGSRAETTLFEHDSPIHVTDVSSDGQYLLFLQGYEHMPSTTWVLPLEPHGEPHVLRPEHIPAYFAQFSPDGKWVAYATTETGRWELYLSPTDGGEKQQLTTTGAEFCRWSADGKSIYFASVTGKVAVVPLSINGMSVAVEKPKDLFEVGHLLNGTFFSKSWDITPDGRRAIVNTTSAQTEQSRAIVLTHWTEKLKK